MARKYFKFFLSVLAFIAFVLPVVAQKKITPVDNDPTKPRQPVLHYYDKHGQPLDEPVLFLADLDTVKQAKPGPVYPLWQSVSVGLNIFDGVMMLTGQKYASMDVWAMLSLHNWILPVAEFGLGFADNKPEEGNYRYKGKPSFYGKLGVNYNFLYKSNPDYQVHLGLRACYSCFRYDITDITINSSYWSQTNRFSIPDQKAHAFYGELLGGIKVKIWKNFSMGWDARFRFKFKSTNGKNSKPWFIPGYGTSAPLSASFSLIYTIPLNKAKNVVELPADVKQSPQSEKPIPESEEDEIPERKD